MSPIAERLLAIAEATLGTMKVEAGPPVMEVIHRMAETGARTLEGEGRADDEEAIRAAEARLTYVLTTASIRTEAPEPDFELFKSFPNHATTLEASSLAEFLDGICPLWPFCT